MDLKTYSFGILFYNNEHLIDFGNSLSSGHESKSNIETI